MRCPEPTTCPPITTTRCAPPEPTACDPCPLDDRPPQPCGTQTRSGGPGVTRTRHALGAQGGTVRITYDMLSIPDRLDCYFGGVLVATTGRPVSGVATLTWSYDPQPGDPSFCQVVVTGPNGTVWSYTLHCPA